MKIFSIVFVLGLLGEVICILVELNISKINRRKEE